MTWSKSGVSGPQLAWHLVAVITGIAFLLAVLITAELSRAHQIVLILGIATVSAALIGLLRLGVSRKTQSQTRTILEALPNPVYLKDRDGRYTGVNSAW